MSLEKYIKKEMKKLRCKLEPSGKISIDTKLINQIVTKEFTNGQSMQALSCLMHFVLNISSFQNSNELTYNNSLRLFTNPIPKKNKEIGKYGSIIASDFYGTSEFVIKSPLDAKVIDSIFIEYFVCLTLNDLRYIIPTFVYALGFFECSKSAKSRLCSSDNSTPLFPHIIYENIPGKTLGRHIIKTTPDAFLNLFIQLLLSLEIAQQKNKFFHQDLHGDNVMVRPGALNYSLSLFSTHFDIQATAIPVFIDFGLSSIEYEGRLISIKNKPLIQGYDMLYILYSCLWTLVTKNENVPLKNLIISLLDFYEPNEEPYEIKQNPANVFKVFGLLFQKGDYGKKISSSPAASKTPWQFLTWILNNYNVPGVKVSPRNNVFNISLGNTSLIFYRLFQDMDRVYDSILDCINFNPSFIMCVYNVQVVQKLNKILKSKSIERKMDVLKEYIETNKQALIEADKKNLIKYKELKIDRNTLENSFKSILGLPLIQPKEEIKKITDFFLLLKPIMDELSSRYNFSVLINETKLQKYFPENEEFEKSEILSNFIYLWPLHSAARTWLYTIKNSS